MNNNINFKMFKFILSNILLKNSYIMVFHHNGVSGSELYDLQELIKLKNSQDFWSVYTTLNAKNKYFCKRAGLKILKIFFSGPTMFFAVNSETVFLNIIKNLPEFYTIMPTIIYYKTQYIEAKEFNEILNENYTVENQLYSLLNDRSLLLIKNLENFYIELLNILIQYNNIIK